MTAADPTVDRRDEIGISGELSGDILARVLAHNVAVATAGNTERPGENVNLFTGSDPTRVTHPRPASRSR